VEIEQKLWRKREQKQMKPKIKILVIEDNENNIYLVTYILEAGGYEVIQARDGREGVEMAHQVKPDLILLDIQLPVMDGYTVALELKGNPMFDNTPIVAVTGYAMTGDREKALAVGCAGYIEKPIRPTTFLTEVEEFLPSQ
jgi:CheY-like chemotaxis protein